MVSRAPALLLIFVGISCTAPAQTCLEARGISEKDLMNAAGEFCEMLGACVELRDKTGAWPREPLDLSALTDRSIPHLDRIQKMIRFEAQAHGLAIIDRGTGKRVMVIANDTTLQHLHVLGGDRQ